MEPVVINLAKEEAKKANDSAYLWLLLIIQFLGRLCNNFSARSIALKECYLMMNFENFEIHCTVFKISVKMQI